MMKIAIAITFLLLNMSSQASKKGHKAIKSRKPKLCGDLVEIGGLKAKSNDLEVVLKLKNNKKILASLPPNKKFNDKFLTTAFLNAGKICLDDYIKKGKSKVVPTKFSTIKYWPAN